MGSVKLTPLIYCIFHLQRLVLLGAVAQVGTQAAGVVLRECVNGGKFLKELPEIAFGVGWVRGLDTAYMRHVMVGRQITLDLLLFQGSL